MICDAGNGWWYEVRCLCFSARLNRNRHPRSSNPEAELAAVHGRCKALVESDKVYLFMKGSPAAPECGFSRQAVALMAKYDLTYSTFDVLSDPEIRAGIKTFGNWPTFPQLYINAKLVGGLDVIKEVRTCRAALFVGACAR